MFWGEGDVVKIIMPLIDHQSTDTPLFLGRGMPYWILCGHPQLITWDAEYSIDYVHMDKIGRSVVHSAADSFDIDQESQQTDSWTTLFSVRSFDGLDGRDQRLLYRILE